MANACRPSLKFLARSDADALVERAVRRLERDGIIVHGGEAQEILSSAGVRVLPRRNLAMPSARHIIPPLGRAPQRVKMFDRNGRLSCVLRGKAIVCAAATGAESCASEPGFPPRALSAADLARIAAFAACRAEIGLQGCAAAIQEIPPPVAEGLGFLLAAGVCVKPLIVRPSGPAALTLILGIAAALRGSEARLRSRPLFAVEINPSAAAGWDAESCAILLACARAGIPSVITPIPPPVARGGRAVFDGAASVLGAALLGAALAQSVAPGTPVIPGIGRNNADSGDSTQYGGMMALSLSVSAAVRQIGLPDAVSLSGRGGNYLDGWLAAQSAMGAALAALGPASLLMGMGGAHGRAISMPGLLTDCRAISSLMTLCGGIELPEAENDRDSGELYPPPADDAPARSLPAFARTDDQCPPARGDYRKDINAALAHFMPSPLKRWLIDDMAAMLGRESERAGDKWALPDSVRALLAGDVPPLEEA
ncbi:MAG TPA: trimethylamine methyltransferase family protein [Candidatus Brocadiia bacterium]|nr:trimethylamine methyltransferase family protein [Candidatus Brocadiia bacterium]